MDTALSLRHLQHAVMLAEELSFGRAAARANLSQTAFSRSIQTAEDRFGLRLFDRDTRSVRVTTAGVQVIASARKLLAQATDLSRQVDDITQAEGGRLAIGATLAGIDGVLADVLPDFRRERPRLEVIVEVGNWQNMLLHLEQERIEFYVGYPGPSAARPDLEVLPLAPLPASIFCRAAHPLLGDGAALARERIADHPWAMVQMPEALATRLRALFRVPAGTALPLSLSCDNQGLLRRAALTSDTLLFTWRSWLSSDLQSGSIVDVGDRLRPRLPATDTRLDCGIVRLAGRTASPAAARLIDSIRGAAGRSRASAGGV